MSYLSHVKYEDAGSEGKEIFDALKKKMGRVPNIFSAMVHSPAALKALLASKQALHDGVLSEKEAEVIALVVGEENGCDYCVAAHTAIAKMAGFSAEEAKGFRNAQSDDPKLKVLAKLAQNIASTRGRPDEEVLKEFYSAGYADAALAEVIAHVSVSIFTNYFNHIAKTEIDFPKPE